jgi:hypothetical protein
LHRRARGGRSRVGKHRGHQTALRSRGHRLAARDGHRAGRDRTGDQQGPQRDKPRVARLLDQLAWPRSSRLTIAPALAKDRLVTNLAIIGHHDLTHRLIHGDGGLKC